MTPTARSGLVAVGAILLVLAAAAPPASAAHPAPALVVDLEADGSATVTLRLTYDLASDAEREAFEELRGSESARRESLDRFRERMSRVANASEERTGRSMAVAAGEVNLTTTGHDVGVVRLAVEWTGLAATDDDRLVVTSPFADGYDPDRRLVVAGPEGYGVGEVTPAPTSRDGRTLQWAPGSSLADFSLTYAPADGARDTRASTSAVEGGAGTGDAATDAPDGASGGAAPGFGVPAALIAVLAAAVALGRRE